MSRNRQLATALAIGLAAFPALAADIPGTDFASGNWVGRAWEDNGQFVDCYFGASFSNGEVMTVSFTADDTLTVYLSAPEMKFDPAKSYDATLMTEVGYPISGKAFAPNEGYIGFSIAGVDSAIDYLTQGSYLRLLGVGIDQSFDVRGMGGALAQGRACLMAQKGGAATAAAEPAAPEKPVLGIKGKGAKPVQMSLDIGTFKRQHMPCKDADCK
jgi:hypothetical protein